MEKEECPGTIRTMSKRRISRVESRPNPSSTLREYEACIHSVRFQNSFGPETTTCPPFIPFSKFKNLSQFSCSSPTTVYRGLWSLHKSNIQTWYRNYHMPPRVHAPWIRYHDLMEFWVFLAGVWVSVSVFCVCGRVIQILMISRTEKTTFINILAQLYRVLRIFTRPNFPVLFCFSEVRWQFLANEMGDKRCGHFRITAFNSWYKTADFTSPHLHVFGSVSQDGALSE